jgi:multiple sugar transport system ATP-binding protein
VKLGIRPEAIELCATGEGDIDGVVDLVEYLGADVFLIVDCGAAGKVTVRVDGDSDARMGAQVGLRFVAKRLHFFDGNGLALM